VPAVPCIFVNEIDNTWRKKNTILYILNQDTAMNGISLEDNTCMFIIIYLHIIIYLSRIYD
jgi:hypothetical protein